MTYSTAGAKHYLRRDDDAWLYTKAAGLESALGLPSIRCELALRDVYDKTA